MPAPDSDIALQRALDRLTESRVVPRVAAALEGDSPKLAGRVYAAVLADVAAFSASHNPDLLPDLDRHVGEHIAELIRLLGGGEVGTLEFVRAYARRRAVQRFPLEAVLQAYRSSHKVIAPAITEAAQRADLSSRGDVGAAVAELVLEYTALLGVVAAAEYVTQTRALAEAEGDRRVELLGLLLDGYDEADGRVARLLRRAGYLEQRHSFCVALAQSTDPLEMENPPRAQRIADAMTAAVSSLPVRALVGLRGNVVAALYSGLRRSSGWTAPQAELGERVRPALLALGPAVLIGLSGDHPSTSYIPRALHEAEVALDLANVGERLVSFPQLPIRRLLVHRGADYVQSALPAWFASFRAANAASGGALLETLRALADADMNVQRAARDLHVHANTLYARLARIRDLTGLEAQRYHDLTHLLLAADCGRL